MIPYFAQPQIGLGPVTIHAFGVLVACAILIGTKIVTRRAVAQGVSQQSVGRFLSWVLIGGFAGAHLVDRLVYFPAETMADPVRILRFWEGLSSFGGFVGGSVGAVLFLHRQAASGSVWTYVDSFAYAFPFAWVLGRAGCFVAYDHPGRPTTFVLGEVYKDGIVRHNLGLDEGIYSIFIATAIPLPRTTAPISRVLPGTVHGSIRAVSVRRRLPEDRRRPLPRTHARSVRVHRPRVRRRRSPREENAGQNIARGRLTIAAA